MHIDGCWLSLRAAVTGSARVAHVPTADDSRRERGMVALPSRSVREGAVQQRSDRQAH